MLIESYILLVISESKLKWAFFLAGTFYIAGQSFVLSVSMTQWSTRVFDQLQLTVFFKG
ncbi:uncharacterized protein METZ01_LOCUS22742 [marine metagenome]|uniref:Uncharacterized protein n=1 Tax=marine metagenome TaxID=408172 RepID=A0A381PTP1_9ZZZZ